MQTENITEMVLNYQRTGFGYEALIKSAGLEVYSILKYKYLMNEDDQNEFFCQFYPSIPKLIKRFEYFGTPFEIYLSVLLKWKIKTFRSAKSKYYNIQKTMNRQPFRLVTHNIDFTDISETDLQISDLARSAFQLEAGNETLTESTKKRILYIYLMEFDNLDERIKEGIIKITGYDKNWVELCSSRLKEKVLARETRIKLFENRRNSAFFEYHLLQEKFRLCDKVDEKERLNNHIKKLNKRICNLNIEISRVPIRPTHKELAEVLNISKGSVDSGIFYIKNSFKNAQELEKKLA